MAIRVASYCRVSAKDQHCSIQLESLREYCARQGWEPIEYIEKASGKTGSKRPILEELMLSARKREIDVVVVTKLDRFGRSVQDVINNIQVLDSCGVRFIALSQGLDTDQRSAISRFMLHVLAAIAELEREFIHERTTAGLVAYINDYRAGKVGKSRSSKSGKNLAPGRPKRVMDRLKIWEMRQAGKSYGEISKATGVPRQTVVRAIKEYAGEPA